MLGQCIVTVHVRGLRGEAMNDDDFREWECAERIRKLWLWERVAIGALCVAVALYFVLSVLMLMGVEWRI